MACGILRHLGSAPNTKNRSAFASSFAQTHSVISRLQLGDLSPSKWAGLWLEAVMSYCTKKNAQHVRFWSATSQLQMS